MSNRIATIECGEVWSVTPTIGIVSAKFTAPDFWVVRAYHLGGADKSLLCAINAYPTEEEADNKVSEYAAYNAKIAQGICPTTGQPITPDMLGITCSERFGIEKHRLGSAK